MDIINNSISLDTIGGGLSALSRQFLTFGGVNESGSIPAWSPTGDFEIELEFSTTTTAFDPLLTPAASAGNNAQVFVNGTAGQVLFEVDNGASAIFVQSGTAVNDGKLHSAKLSRVGNDYSVSVDGGIPATQTLSGAIMNFTNVGNVDTNFYPGVIANLRLTDTAGGDNRFYPMKSGSLTTEQNALNPGVNDMTLNNIVSTDWEKFTQVGADWLGGELFVSPALGGNWVDEGAGVYSLVGDGTFENLQVSNVLVSGRAYKAKYTVDDIASDFVTYRSTSIMDQTSIAESREFTYTADGVNVFFTRLSAIPWSVTLSAISTKRILEAP